MTIKPKRKKALFVVVSGVVFFVGFVALAEGLVRIRQAVKYGRMKNVDDTLTLDKSTGLRMLIPGLVMGNIRVNSLGFRSPELEEPKDPSAIRLAFVGASTTYCAEASRNEMTWPHLVAEKLREAFPEARFDYLNAGVPGNGVEDSLKILQLRIEPLGPDVVVIYHASNDLSSDSYDVAHEQGVIESRPSKPSWLSNYSLLWLLIEKNVKVAMRQAAANSERGKLIYDPRELSRNFEERLLALVQASQQAAGVVAIATFSTRIRSEQSPEERVRSAVTASFYMPYMTIDGLLAGYQEYNRVIREVANGTGAFLIEGETVIPGDDVHFKDSIHFTDAGSVAMAHRVSEALLSSPRFLSLIEERTANAAPPQQDGVD